MKDKKESLFTKKDKVFWDNQFVIWNVMDMIIKTIYEPLINKEMLKD